MADNNTSLPPINYADEHLYEHLTLIIEEFEKAALRSGSRQGIMATAQAPLAAMDQILASSDRALSMGRTANASRVSQPATSTGQREEKNSEDTTQAPVSGTGDETVEEDSWYESHGELELVTNHTSGDIDFDGENVEIQSPSFEIGTNESVSFDADLNEFLNGEDGGAQIGDWLKDCLGCDLRINFDWQLQPIDLLGPIGDLLADINSALDKFEGFFDENALMKNLCDLLNGLNFLCIPDLLAILMALKMLFKSYLNFQLSINLDWTMLLGPLLKLILDAIATLMQQIAGIVVAPLDCAYAALASIAELQDELAETAALAAAVGARIGDTASAFTSGDGLGDLTDTTVQSDAIFKDVDVFSQDVVGNEDDGGRLPDVEIPALSTTSRTASEEPKEGTFSFPTGFELTAETRLPEALEHPDFLLSNPFKQLAVSVKEARDYIMDLVKKIIFAVRSLEGLTSGSLSLSLGNLGLLLFIQDMIQLVLIIIKLFSGNQNVKDWCEHLRNNPEIVEGVFPGTTAEVDEKSIRLFNGPEMVVEIKTCSSDRTDAQAAIMQKWILDLKRAGSV